MYFQASWSKHTKSLVPQILELKYDNTSDFLKLSLVWLEPVFFNMWFCS